MNYSKIKELQESKKISNKVMAEAIGLSKSGYEKMLRDKTCKISTLENISAYFNKPLMYFFDSEQEKKVYSEDNHVSVLEDTGGRVLTSAEKDAVIIEMKERIDDLKYFMRLLIERIGADNLGELAKKLEVKQVRGFGNLNDPKMQMILNNIFSKRRSQ